jgi:hypothetical protein
MFLEGRVSPDELVVMAKAGNLDQAASVLQAHLSGKYFQLYDQTPSRSSEGP